MTDSARDGLHTKGQSCEGPDSGNADVSSRRRFLTDSAALAVAGTLVPTRTETAFAQGTDAAGPDLNRLQTSSRILLKGGVVLTLDRQVGDFAQADVLIDAGKIAQVRPNIETSDNTVEVDASNQIIIPGFVDTHSHSYQGLLRNILTNGVLEPEYTRDIQNTLTPAYQAADAYAGILVTALGFIEMGTTTIVDISQVSHTPDHSDACIQALRDSGIRAVYTYYRGQGPGSRYPQDIRRLQQAYFSSKDQLLTLALGTNINASNYTLARDVGVSCVLHINNLSAQILELGRTGLLRPGDEYIHCTHLNDDAWRLIRDTGGHVSLSNQIEMAMGQGLPAIQQALDHGVRPSLSSDHGCTVAQDFFSVMRSTFTLQHLQLFQRAFAGEQNLPPRLSPRDVLEFATIEGARCANLESQVGTLTPGKDADIVMLRTDRLSVWPLNNAPGMVVNLMNPSHVDAVFIAGKIKKWRGNLVGVDMPRVLRLVQEARDAVVRRARFPTNLLG
jgi:cytosine/adenosine deaminase-related metal-dependent hydrolase